MDYFAADLQEGILAFSALTFMLRYCVQLTCWWSYLKYIYAHKHQSTLQAESVDGTCLHTLQFNVDFLSACCILWFKSSEWNIYFQAENAFSLQVLIYFQHKQRKWFLICISFSSNRFLIDSSDSSSVPHAASLKFIKHFPLFFLPTCVCALIQLRLFMNLKLYALWTKAQYHNFLIFCIYHKAWNNQKDLITEKSHPWFPQTF